MSGRISLLTGATGAIGKELAKGLSLNSDLLILAVRDLNKGHALAQELMSNTGKDNIRLATVDLAHKDSIRAFGNRFRDEFPKLDVLVNNAAVVSERKRTTTDGLELQFGVNVLGYYMVMMEVMSSLVAAGPHSRVVNVASNYAGDLDLSDLQFEKRKYDGNVAYRQSKQANRMMTWAAAEKYYGKVNINACHPGVVTSALLHGLGMKMGFNSAADGAATPLMLAIGKEAEGHTGEYWHNKQSTECHWHDDTIGCNHLWRILEEEAARR